MRVNLKHLGLLGFAFFFCKGMLWLIVPVLAVLWGKGCSSGAGPL